MKQMFLMLVALFVMNSASAESCFPEGVTFIFQSQINSFRTDYPDCTEIEGNLVISGYNIENLNGLIGITSIGGNLMIESNEVLKNLEGLNNLISIGNKLYIEGNFSLINLSGLENLQYIGGDVVVSNNISLTSMSGLEGLSTIEGMLSIEYNDMLSNLTGLDHVVSVDGVVRFFSNALLNSLTGLEGLTFIGGGLFIGGQGHLGGLGNPSLNSLMALSALTSIGGQLMIGYNSSLTSLDGIGNIGAGSITGLNIFNNPMLSTCEVQSICDYLANPAGTIEIYSNAAGCNSQAEVEEACISLNASVIANEMMAKVWFNTARDKITVETTGLPVDFKYSLSNLKGQVISEGSITGSITVLDIASLPGGFYLLRLTSERSVMVEKLIKP